MARHSVRMRAGRVALGALLALAACTQEPEVVGSNCEEDQSCVEETNESLERIDSVDILLVVDSSGSIRGEAEALRAELPRMLNAIVTGSGEDMTFPPASSVHVAVITPDMGVGGKGIAGCDDRGGDDGLFLRPGQVGLTCETSFPGYLAYEGGPAAIATAETVSCVPLPDAISSDDPELRGCGFEQPLEATLKALWPASNPAVTFMSGGGHGEDANAGFLRSDSLLVVVVVTDEDDCSAEDLRIFTHPDFLSPSDPLRAQDLGLRCWSNLDLLHATSRYIDGLKALRPDNPHLIFVTVAGVPPDLVSEETRADYDFTSEEDVAAYMEAVLDDPRMQQVPDPTRPPGSGDLVPSCVTMDAYAYPPRRLVEVTKAFGTQGVLGSICGEFGETTGLLIRTIGQRLAEAAEGSPDAG